MSTIIQPDVSLGILRECGPMTTRELTEATAEVKGKCLTYEAVYAVMCWHLKRGEVEMEHHKDYRENTWSAVTT